MPPGTASILLVDDQALIGAAMVVALQAHGFGPVVAADVDDLSLEAVLDTARQMKPDIALVDVHLGKGRLGVPLVAPLVETGTKVLLFTATADSRLIAEGLREGAEAVLDKTTSFEEMVAALRDLVAGRELMPPEVRNTLIESLDQGTGEKQEGLLPFLALTDREAHVLRALVDGQSHKLIARNDATSVSTVRGDIERIMQKLDVRSEREALALARTAGWRHSAGP